MSQKENQHINQDSQIDIELQTKLQLLLNNMDQLYQQARTYFTKPHPDRLDFHFYKLKSVQHRILNMLVQFKQKLIIQDMAIPPSTRVNYYSMLNHPLNSFVSLDRNLLLSVSLQGCDVEVKPSQAVLQLITRIQQNSKILQNEIRQLSKDEINIVGRLQTGFFSNQVIPQQRSIKVYHSLSQIQLYLYFLLHYIKKVSKVLGQKSLQILKQKLQSVIPIIIKCVLKVIKTVVIQNKEINKNWLCFRVIKNLSSANQQIVKLNIKWNYFNISSLLLQTITLPNNQSQDRYCTVLLDLIQNQFLHPQLSIFQFLQFYIRQIKLLSKLITQFIMPLSICPFQMTKIKLYQFFKMFIPTIFTIIMRGVLWYNQIITDFKNMINSLAICGFTSIIDQCLKQYFQQRQESYHKVQMLKIQLRDTYQQQILLTYSSNNQQISQVILDILQQSVVLSNSKSKYLIQFEKRRKGYIQRLQKKMQNSLHLLNPSIRLSALQNFVASAFKQLNQLKPLELTLSLKAIDYILPVFLSKLTTDKHNSFSKIILCSCQYWRQLVYGKNNQLSKCIRSINKTVIQIIGKLQLHSASTVRNYKQKSNLFLFLQIMSLHLSVINQQQILQQFIQCFTRLNNQLTGQQAIKLIIQSSSKNIQQQFLLFDRLFFTQPLRKLNQKIMIGNHKTIIDIYKDKRIKRTQQNLKIVQSLIKDKQGFVYPPINFYRCSQLQIRINIINVDWVIDRIFINLSKTEQIGLVSIINRLVDKIATKQYDKQLQLLIKVFEQRPIIYGLISNIKVNCQLLKNNQKLFARLPDLVNFTTFIAIISITQDKFKILLNMIITSSQVRFINNKCYYQQQNQHLLYDICHILQNTPKQDSFYKEYCILLVDLIIDYWPYLRHINRIEQILRCVPWIIDLTTKDYMKRKEIVKKLFKYKQQYNNINNMYQQYQQYCLQKCIHHIPSQTCIQQSIDQDNIKINQNSTILSSVIWVMQTSIIIQSNPQSLINIPQPSPIQSSQWPSQTQIYAKLSIQQNIVQQLQNQQPLQKTINDTKQSLQYRQHLTPLKQTLIHRFNQNQLYKLYIANPYAFLQLTPSKLRQQTQMIIKDIIKNRQKHNQNKKYKQKRKSMVQVWGETLSYPTLTHNTIQQQFYNLLKHNHTLQFCYMNTLNYQRLLELSFLSFLFQNKSLSTQNQIINTLIQTDHQYLYTTLIKFWAKFQYHLRLFYQPIQKLGKVCTPTALILLSTLNQNDKTLTPLILIIRRLLILLSSSNSWAQPLLKKLVDGFFSPFNQNKQHNIKISKKRLQYLYYSVQIDNQTLNLVLKYIRQYPWLRQIKHIIHSNYSNMRLYTDKFTEGLKSMNLASKIRCFNEYLKISNQTKDTQLSIPLQIFKQNMIFYIQIIQSSYRKSVKQAYKNTFSIVQQIIRKGCKDSSTQIQDQIKKAQIEIASFKQNLLLNYKSVYLSAKLRDFFNQSAKTMQLIIPFIQSSDQSIIESLQMYTLLQTLYSRLLLFQDNPKNQSKFKYYYHRSDQWLQKQISLSTARRSGGMLYRVLNDFEIDFDLVMQQYIGNSKYFFTTEKGRKWLQKQAYSPALLITNRIYIQKRQQEIIKIINQKKSVQENSQELILKQGFMLQQTSRLICNLNSHLFTCKQPFYFKTQSKIIHYSQFITLFTKQLLNHNILLPANKYLKFNHLKTSQSSLQVIKTIGKIIAHAIIYSKPIYLNLHDSIIKQISGKLLTTDQVADYQKPVWQHLKSVLNHSNSKQLGLSFVFERTFDGITKKYQLIPKGIGKKVNNLNRQEYADAIVQLVLSKTYERQLKAFLTGLYSVLSKQICSNFTFSELVKIIRGQNLTVMDQKDKLDIIQKGLCFPQSTQNSKDEQIIRWFWQWLNPDNIKILTKNYQLKFEHGLGTWILITKKSSKKQVIIKDGQLIFDIFQNKQQLIQAMETIIK